MTEPDTKELDALLDSVNGSAERLQTLWFSFLGLTLYLAITALTTTHRMLLLGEAQTLPVLNMKVELLPFYVIAPLFYVVVHFYVLMMLVLLARTAAPFESELQTTLPIEADRELYRARVENALFLQMLVGPKPERAGFNGFLLATIALITIVLAPIATLVLMQMMFLPYHSLPITWWHRILVLADSVLIIVMWRRYFHPSGIERPAFLFRHRDRLRKTLALAANFCLIGAVLWLSLWEGRWAGENVIGRGNFAKTESGVVFGLFPDRLKLENEVIVGESRLDEIKKEIASRGGDFVPTLRLDGRDLRAALLNGSDLRRVSLLQAVMQDATLRGARLDGADLSGALLQGADLAYAQLQGAVLTDARLRGAGLTDAQLQGADLFGTRLRGADFSEAQLQGAGLAYAQLQGADLSGALLQGADLALTELQGADLGGAQMADSEFDKTLAFRTDISNANLSTSAIRSVGADRVWLGDRYVTNSEPLTPAGVDKWIAAATAFARDTVKAGIAKRFDRLRPDFQTAEEDAADQAKWLGAEDASLALDPDGANHRRRVATILTNLACEADGAPYLARGIIDNGRLAALGDQLDGVRDRMKAARKNPETCPGVAGFSEDDWRKLDAIKPVQDQNASETTTSH